MNNLVENTMAFLSSAIEVTTEDYNSNFKKIVSNTREIGDMIIETKDKSVESFQKVWNSPQITSVRNWFSNKTKEYDEESLESGSDDDDEFDSGIGDMEDDERPSAVLDAEAMKDITRGQVGAMYNIAAKQNESSIISTSRIIGVIETQTNFIVGGLKTVSDSTKRIETKLDALIKAQSTMLKLYSDERERNSAKRDNSLTDYDGSISPVNMAKAIKDNSSIMTGMFGMLSSMLGSFVRESSISDLIKDPANLGMLAGMGIKKLISERKPSILGGRTVKEAGEELNEIVGAITNTIFADLAKSDLFNKLSGGAGQKRESEDYQKARVGHYDDSPTVFDNKTKITINNIIPNYLKTISEALTGNKYHISDKGDVVAGSDKNVFGIKSTSKTFVDTLSSRETSVIKEKMSNISDKISDKDIKVASEALTSVFVQKLYASKNRTMSANDVADYSEADVFKAAKRIASAVGGDLDYWIDICSMIMIQMGSNINMANKFSRNVMMSFKQMDAEARKIANSSSTFAQQAGIITDAMFDEGFSDKWGNNQPSSVMNGSSVGNSNISIPNTIQNIYGILNRGINVRVTGRTPYGDFTTNAPSGGGQTPIQPNVTNPNAQEDVRDWSGEKVTGEDVNNVLNTIAGHMSQIPIVGNIVQTAYNSPLGKGIREFGSNVGYIVSDKIDAAKNDARNLGERLSDHAMNAINDAAINSKLNSMDDTEEDKLQAQLVLNLMNSAVQDGDGEEDVTAINAEINKIKDSELKRRLQYAVPSMLKRSSGKSTEVKPESKIGKIISFALKGIKTLAAPVISIVKSGFSLITKGVSGIFSLVKKYFQPEIDKITAGAQSIGEGLFGNKEERDENGNIIKTASTGLFGKAKANAKQKASARKESFNNFRAGAREFGSNIKEVTSDAMTDAVGEMAEGLRNTGEKVKGSFLGKAASFVGNFGKNYDETKREADQQILNDANDTLKWKKYLYGDKDGSFAKNQVSEAQSQADYAKGRMNAYNILDQKQADRQKPKTPAAEVKSVLTGETPLGAASPLSKIISLLDKIAHPDKTPSIAEQSNSAASAISGSTQSSSSSLGGLGSSSDDVSSVEETIEGAIEGGSEQTENQEASRSEDKGKVSAGMSMLKSGITGLLIKLVMGLSGVKAAINLTSRIVKNVMKPIEKVSKQLYKAIKPALESVGRTLKALMTSVGSILSAIVESIKPILELIGPLVQMIFDAVKPILDIVTILVKTILAPFIGLISNVLVPVVKQIGYSVQVISGALQFGLGVIIGTLGAILTGIGTITKFFGAGDGLAESGKKLMNTGGNLIDTGMNDMVSGVKGMVSNTLDTMKSVVSPLSTEESDEVRPERKVEQTELHGSVMDGVYGSGDSQRSYGNYLNMGERGCGPVALADMYARRSGKALNSGQLAASMSQIGAYSPEKGTSVSDYIRAGKSLGMNMHAGGVTPDSLKSASVNSPVTVVGSGLGFNTKSGNNHYVNVIGTDRGGNALIANPLTGRVGKASIHDLSRNSLVGIYGSGDKDYGGFSDETQSLLDELKELAGNFIKIFTGEDDITTAINEANESSKNDQAYELASSTLSDSEMEEVTRVAREKFEKDNPKRDGESDDKYEKRWEAERKKYIVEASQGMMDETMSKYKTDRLGDGTEANSGSFASTINSWNSVKDTTASAADAAQSGGFGNNSSSGVGSGNGMFVSANGAVMARPAAEDYPRYTENNITVTPSEHGILMDFFRAMTGSKVEEGSPFGSYARSNLTQDGEKREYGNNGSLRHKGVDLWFHTRGTDVHATTGGKVIKVDNSFAVDQYRDGSYGNYVQIQDAGGDKHTYAHLNRALVSVGDQIEGGQVIGKSGTTGHSTGPHLHYDIRDAKGNFYNPNSFFKYNPNWNSGDGEPVNMNSTLKSASAWSSYVNHPGRDAFIKAAIEQGYSAGEIATIISTGIWEDSGKKIFGDKSLTGATFDYNGQIAYGILNSMDKSVVNSSTKSGQLKQIRDFYFRGQSGDYRQKVRDNNIELESLYRDITGRGYNLRQGDYYGPTVSSDVIEGSNHFFASGLVPADMNAIAGTATRDGVAKHIGTAADIYNWLITSSSYPEFKPQAFSGGSGAISGTASASDTILDEDLDTYTDYAKYGYTSNSGVTIDIIKSMQPKSNDGKTYYVEYRGRKYYLDDYASYGSFSSWGYSQDPATKKKDRFTALKDEIDADFPVESKVISQYAGETTTNNINYFRDTFDDIWIDDYYLPRLESTDTGYPAAAQWFKNNSGKIGTGMSIRDQMFNEWWADNGKDAQAAGKWNDTSGFKRYLMAEAKDSFVVKPNWAPGGSYLPPEFLKKFKSDNGKGAYGPFSKYWLDLEQITSGKSAYGDFDDSYLGSIYGSGDSRISTNSDYDDAVSRLAKASLSDAIFNTFTPTDNNVATIDDSVIGQTSSDTLHEMMNHTFKVRNEEVEKRLDAILEKLESRGAKTPKKSTPVDDFDDSSIPDKLVQMYTG